MKSPGGAMNKKKKTAKQTLERVADMPRLIFADTHQQFAEYWRARNLNPHQARFVGASKDLRGLRDLTLIRTGTWYEREDRHGIEQLCLMNRFAVREEKL